MMIKRLTRQGNSAALIIDRTLMDLMDIDQHTELRLTVNGRQLLVEPLAPAARRSIREGHEEDGREKCRVVSTSGEVSFIMDDPLFLSLDEVLQLHDLAVDEMEQLVLGVAKGETSKEQVAAFFRDRLPS